MRFIIFSSILCNMTCPYCAVAVNKHDASSLPYKDVKAGIDAFLDPALLPRFGVPA